MKNQTGIWIDKEKAEIIALIDNEVKRKTIESDISGKERIPGETNESGRFGKQFLSGETKKGHHLKHQIEFFLKEVITSLNEADEIVVFGPAEMKMELKKEIEKNHQLKDRLKGVEPADKMTDNQMVAWVKDFFEE